jgi:putative PIN family toxin of toxin-antitoxin system
MHSRIVIDTNIYVSRFLRPDSVPGNAVAKAWTESTVLTSAAVWQELRAVLMRAKFARYVQPGTVEPFLRQVWAVSEEVLIPTPIRACRDPRDDKFLEVAVHGGADLIVTGDRDLLDLHPFHGILILTPAEFMQRK